MPITVRCPNPACGKAFQVPDSYAGKQGRCSACQQRFLLSPAAATTAAEAVQTAPAPRPAAAAAPPERVARFVVRARLGAGAFGTVYRAWDPHLEREVALKVPQAAVLDSPKRVERFLREAKAAAGLRHPHIVPVYDAGEDGDVRYIASAFIEGKPLSSAVEEKGMDCQRAARIVRHLAEALGYAHGLGVVHRDVKPANVMLDAEDRPHLMDFGLAARLESTEKLTHEGAVLGTPSYMAPEQAEGQQGEAKPESDQYALGVVLYELLTGRTPFEGPPQIVLFNVLHTEPPAPRSLRKDLPRDLETICLKAMAKRPEDRYSDCQALADDLGRWLDGEPIRARRLGIGERFVRWCKREPKLAAASGLLALSLVVLASSVGLYFVRHYRELWAETSEKLVEESEGRARAEAERDEEKAGHARARRDLNLEYLNQAQARLDADDRAGASRVLQRCAVEQRGWAWQHLLLLAEGSGQAVRVLRWPGRERFVGSGLAGIAFSADSQLLAGLDRDHATYLWHVGSGKGLRMSRLARHNGWGRSAAFSADGRIAAAVIMKQEEGGGPKAVRADDHFEIAAQVGPPRRKEPAPRPNMVVIWNAVSGEKLHAVEGPAGDQTFLQLSGDGSRVAAAAGQWNQSAEVRIYDVKSGKEVLAKRRRFAHLRHLAIAPDGKTVATISGDDPMAPSTLTFWDAESGQEGLKLEGETAGVEQVLFSGDGKLIIGSGGGERMVMESVVVPETMMYEVTVEVDVTKEVDGKKVVVKEKRLEKRTRTVYKTVTVKRMVGDSGEQMRLWAADSGKLLHTLPACGGGVLAAAVSPDGTLLARVCHGPCSPAPHLSLYDLRLGRRLLKSPVPDGIRVGQLLFSPDGRHLAGAEQDGSRVVLWSSSGSRLLYQYDAHGGAVTDLVFSPDGRLLSSFSACNGSARVWAVRTGKERLVVRAGGHGGYGYGYGYGYGGHGGPGMGVLRFSADGQRLTSQALGGVGAWDRRTGKPIEFPKDVGRVLALSPDGKWIVTAPDLPKVAPPANGAEKAPEKVPEPRKVARLDRAGPALLATLFMLQGPPGAERPKGPPLEVKVREAASGKEACTLKGLPAFGVAVSFSPDGQRVLSVVQMGWDERGPRSEVKVWDARSGAVLLTHTGATGVAAFSRDGARLASVHLPPLPAPPPRKMPGNKKPVEGAAEEISHQEVPVEGPPRAAPPKPEIKVFDVAGGKELFSLTSKEAMEQVQRLHFGPDGKYLAAVCGRFGEQLRVAAWDAGTGKQVLWRGDFAGQLAFSPDGRRLALAVGGQGPEMGLTRPVGPGEEEAPAVKPPPARPEVKVCDLASGKVLLSLAGHGERIAGLAFSPDGRRIATTAGAGLGPIGPPPRGAGEVLVRDVSSGQVLATFTGHTGPVSAIAFSPDGSLLATGGFDGSVKVWLLSVTITIEGTSWEVGRATTAATLGERKLRHWEAVENVAFSPDGKTAASSGADWAIRLHDVETGRELRVLLGHQGPVRALAYRPDGKLLATGSWDGIKLWDLATGQVVRTLRERRWVGRILALAFSPDGKTLAAGTEHGKSVQLWNADNGALLRTIAAQKAGVAGVAFRPDGKALATAALDGAVHLWGLADGKELKAFPGHKGHVWSVQFLPGGKTLATGGADGIIRLWDADSGKETKSLKAGEVHGLAVSPDGKLLASAGQDTTIKLWKVDDDKPIRTLTGHLAAVRAVAFDRDGTRIVSAGHDRTVRLWQVESGKELLPPVGHVSQVYAVAYQPGGALLASAGWDGTVRLWDVAARRERAVLKGHNSPVYSLAFLGGKELASIGEDGVVRLWDVAAAKEVRQLRQDGSGPGRSLAVSPDGKLLAAGYHNGHAIRLWDVEAGKVRHVLTGHKGEVMSLVFLPDGTLASGSHDSTVKLWDVDTGKEKNSLVEAAAGGHGPGGPPAAWVWSVALGGGGKLLAAAQQDGRVRLWDVAKGKRRRDLEGQEYPVQAVAFRGDGKLLASGNERARIVLWEPNSGTTWETVPLGAGFGRVGGLAFSPDALLASGNGDGTISLLHCQ